MRLGTWPMRSLRLKWSSAAKRVVKTSIRTRLVVAFIGLAIVPLLLIGAILSRQSYIVQREQALELQQAVVQYASRRSADFIYRLESELRQMIRVQGLANQDRDGQRRILSRLQSYTDAFVELSLLDTQGEEQMRVSQVAVVTAADFGDRSQALEYVIPMASGETYYGPVWFDAVTGEPLMTLGMPVVDVRDGVLDGVVVADIRLKEIWDLIGDIRVGETGSAYLLDDQGKVVAHRNPSVVLRGTSFHMPDQNGIQTGLNGTRVILVSKEITLGEQTLTLVTERPASEAFALTVRTLLITGVLISAALAAAGVLGFMIVRQIVQPTMGLAATARALATGDLTQRAQAGRNDELGVLAQVFNTMADELEKTIGSLEQRVAERTEALSRANEELEAEVAERSRAEVELARSNAELEQFAYVASHDLQEPLRKIMAFGDLLVAEHSDTPSERGHDYPERMQDAARRMQTLINDLLAYSRVTTRGRPFTPVDLTQVANEVLSDLQIRVEQSGGRVELSDLPNIDADPLQMRQLLQNLIGNALKYQRADAAPVVKVYEQPLNGHEGALCQINVQDNGIGFDEKYLDRIFVPFQRLHSRNEYEGTGIGLAICSKIVQRHGGSITAKSTPGQGATFMVALPRKQSKDEVL